MNGHGNASHRTQCPLCTSILTKPERARAMRKNIAPLAQIEQERNRMMGLLFAILREHGGEIVVRRIPTDDEVTDAQIEYHTDPDGALRISLPRNVIVEAGTLIRTEG